MIKKSAACTDRQPYSLCSSRKSLSQQLDCPAGRATVRMEGRRGARRGLDLAVAEGAWLVGVGSSQQRKTIPTGDGHL